MFNLIFYCIMSSYDIPQHNITYHIMSHYIKLSHTVSPKTCADQKESNINEHFNEQMSIKMNIKIIINMNKMMVKLLWY